MSVQTGLAAASVLLFAAFVALGMYVSTRPLGALDARAVHLRGRFTPAALIFTKSGRSKGLTMAFAVAVVIFALARWPVWIPVLMIVSQVLSQMVVELIKLRYRRTRPDYWLDRLDAGHSYPSGHATTSVVFFGGWAVIAAYGALPHAVSWVLIGVLALWAAGVCWSRLALGAHYASDVAGGLLFGGAWLCGLAAASHALAHVP